jgi:multiple sugar transport system ATP-binding protein
MASIRIEAATRVYAGEVRALDHVDLTIGDGEFLVLVGPSGCGKSTLLRSLAGLETLDEGRVLIGDVDVTTRRARERDIAMVFQNYALYPQMTVSENLEFGLKSRKMSAVDRRTRVAEVASILGLEPLLNRRPGELSGGQRQRVAMGRAIVRRPTAFLMDEPLSNLDAKLRVSMRSELAKMHDRLGVTTVYVTHDQVEAMTLGDRVAVMRDGVIQQCDTPRQLFDHPVNLFVAAFIGSPSMNLVHGDVGDGRVRIGGWDLPLSDGHPLAETSVRQVVIGIRPTDFSRDAVAPADWPRVDVRPVTVEELGHERIVLFRVDATRVEIEGMRAAHDLGDSDQVGLFADDVAVEFSALLGGRAVIATDATLRLAIDTSALHFFDPIGGGAIGWQEVSG